MYDQLQPPALSLDAGLIARLQGYAARLGIIERRFLGWDYVEDASQQSVAWNVGGDGYYDGNPTLELNLVLVKNSYILLYVESEMTGNFPQVAIRSSLWPTTQQLAMYEPANSVPWTRYAAQAPGSSFSQFPAGALWTVFAEGPSDLWFRIRMACTGSSGTASFRNRKMYAAVM